MDIEEFACSPTSPRWEVPRDMRTVIQSRDGDSKEASLQATDEVLEDRALLLGRTAHQLERLSSGNTGKQAIQQLLKPWFLNTGFHAKKLQPNLLAWLTRSEALRYAVKNRRPDIMQLLLSYGLTPEVNAISEALEHVLDSKNTSILKLLIEGGWDINRVYNRVRPSIMSCLVDEESLVRWCLSLGGDPNGLSPCGTTVLHRAACIGSLESFKLLIAAGGRIKPPCPSDDVIAVAVDCHDESNDRTPMIDLLLDLGADINAYYGQNHVCTQPSGMEVIMGKQTALHVAIGRGETGLVKFLMKRGSDASKLMWNYSTAYSTIREHAGAPGWQEHVKWLDAVEYALFLGFESIADFLRTYKCT